MQLLPNCHRFFVHSTRFFRSAVLEERICRGLIRTNAGATMSIRRPRRPACSITTPAGFPTEVASRSNAGDMI